MLPFFWSHDAFLCVKIVLCSKARKQEQQRSNLWIGRISSGKVPVWFSSRVLASWCPVIDLLLSFWHRISRSIAIQKRVRFHMMPNMDGHHALYLYIVQIRYEIRVLNSQCLKFTLHYFRRKNSNVEYFSQVLNPICLRHKFILFILWSGGRKQINS